MAARQRLPYPNTVAAVLVEIGHGIRIARLRRRQTARDLADRIDVSLPTLLKLERGDAGVSLGTFATALWVLNLLEPVRDAVSPERDRIAGALAAMQAPKRARRRKDPDLDRL
ncbi:MAG: transcriptional regulator [Alphaproteobacteria bacterium]